MKTNLHEMKIYVVGPMSGIPDYNYPAFKLATHNLRVFGYIVECPTEHNEPLDNNWLLFMRLALFKLLRCDAIVLLDGWEQSKGASIEKRLAEDLGYKIYQMSDLVF